MILKGKQLMLTSENLNKTFLRTVPDNRMGRFSKKAAKKKESFLAVQDVSFELRPGEILGILGPNGAGKTTLLRMLGGILTPSSGQVLLDGIPITQLGYRYREVIGYLSGNTKLYGRLTPRELISIFGELYGMDKATVNERIDAIIAVLSIGGFADDRIEKLSTGQTQRVSIARCLVHSPRLYIFDEPTLGLDVLGSHAIVRFMQEERNAGKSVLYSTHYMEEAELLCDRIILLHRGTIMATGTPGKLREQTGTESVKDAFLHLLHERGETIE